MDLKNLVNTERQMIERNIESCTTEEHLQVCHTWIDNFRDRYLGIIPRVEWGNHCIHLNNMLQVKRKQIQRAINIAIENLSVLPS